MRHNRSLRVSIALVAFAVGCQSAAAKHEALGDEAYVQGKFAEAFAEYRLAGGDSPSATLRAKGAVAALNAGSLNGAAIEFTALGQAYADRAVEAADGLERVAQAASRTTNGEALKTALAGLQSVAKGRAIGNFARDLAIDLGESPDTPEALDILIYAAAAAPDVDQQDSLMFVYSSVLRRLGRCGAAVPVLESLARRGRVSNLLRETRSWGAGCAISIGMETLE